MKKNGQMLWKTLVIGVLMMSDIYSAEKNLVASSGDKKVQLIELYSSESCSSCPPADKWISELKEKPELWKNFVPVVFHVTYWNHLGWVDGYSSEMMTKRQSDLSSQWPTSRVYTPSFIVDGKEWAEWGNLKTLPNSPAKNAEKINLSLYKKENGDFLVESHGQNKDKNYIIHIVQMGMELQSKVKSGENSGKTLTHNFIVLDWLNKGLDKNLSGQLFHFKKIEKNQHLAYAAWIEEKGNPAPLQAVGNYLKE